MYLKPILLSLSLILATGNPAFAASARPSDRSFAGDTQVESSQAAGQVEKKHDDTMDRETDMPEARTTLVDGHRISYIDQGEGPPVLLLHGIPTNKLMWRKVVPALSDNFRVIAPDLLNFGQSAKPEIADVSINAQRRVIFGLMDALGIRRAHLVAHDIGGGVAQLMAVDRPERIDRLILIDAVSFDSWPVPEFEPLQQPGAEAEMELDQFIGMIRSFMPRGVVDKSVMTESVIDLYLKPWSSEVGKRAFFRNLRRLDPEYTQAISAELGRLPHPTLIIWGEKDPFQNIEYAERLTRTIPDSRKVVIENTGHWLLEEKPAEISTLIRQFLSSE